MTMTMRSRRVGAGTRLQAGIPKEPKGLGPEKARGLFMRGVVVATYVTDDENHPHAGDTQNVPLAVYCDVLVYNSISKQRWFGLKEVLVAQEVGGLHRGRIWKPRAAKLSATEQTDQVSNPAYLDGDHVLIGFMNNSLNEPVIIKSLPHPLVDLGREDRNLGQRMKLKKADGDPDFFRHHGVHHGVDDSGNFIVDSTFANDGTLVTGGKEPAPPTDGKGTQTHKLPQDAKFEAIFYDMSNPASPVEVARWTFQKDKVIILMPGKAVKSVALADFLETYIMGHTHPDGMGGTGTPAQPWDSAINSEKLTCSEN